MKSTLNVPEDHKEQHEQYPVQNDNNNSFSISCNGVPLLMQRATATLQDRLSMNLRSIEYPAKQRTQQQQQQ